MQSDDVPERIHHVRTRMRKHVGGATGALRVARCERRTRRGYTLSVCRERGARMAAREEIGTMRGVGGGRRGAARDEADPNGEGFGEGFGESGRSMDDGWNMIHSLHGTIPK